MAIWIAQFIDQEIRLIDYIEGQGQVLGYYTSELRARGYDRCECYLPHDGVNSNVVTGLRFADHLRDARFPVTVIRNMVKGAAAQRIEAVRRLLPKCSFNEATTSAGLASPWTWQNPLRLHADRGPTSCQSLFVPALPSLSALKSWSTVCGICSLIALRDYHGPDQNRSAGAGRLQSSESWIIQ